jgi:ABC-type transport system involved in multi-copper enzyme maturation permease subunit
MERKYKKAILGILIAFAIGLVGFYAFSAMYGDGLEKVMEDNGVEEADQIWTAPLDYGEAYLGSLVMGIVGFSIIFFLFLGLYLVVRKRKKATKSS